MSVIIGIFIIMHGIVYLLYAGQSIRLFELQSGMVWPDDSWAFAKRYGNETVRRLAGILCLLAAIGFASGGLGIFVSQGWWRPVVAGSAIFSIVFFILLWDGKAKTLADKGLVGIIINMAILVVLIALQWPDF